MFYEWFQEQLIPNLPEKSCIVMDRATYHMVPEERIIPTQMRKLEIQEWLTEQNIFWEEHWLKPKLIDALEQRIDRTPLVQKEAQKYGHQLLILPVHHPELNPIELIWALVKNKCTKKLRNGMSFKDILANLKEEFGFVSIGPCGHGREMLAERLRRRNAYWRYWLPLTKGEAQNSGVASATLGYLEDGPDFRSCLGLSDPCRCWTA